MAERYPHREESERAVVAAAVHGGQDDKAAPYLRERVPVDAFYLPAHRAIWQAVTDLVDNGRPVDALSISDELQSQRAFQLAGGASYLDGLLDCLPVRLDLDGHVDILLDLMAARRWLDAERIAARECIKGADMTDVRRMHAEASKHLVARSKSLARGEALDAVLKRGTTNPVRVDIEGGLGAMIGALFPGQIALVAGPTNVGKTGLLLSLALQSALDGTPVAVVALEESQEEVEVRLAAALAWVDIWKINAGRMEQVERRRVESAQQRIAQLPLWVEWVPGGTSHDVAASIRGQIDRNKVRCVFVDYVQAICGGREEYESIRGSIGAIERSMGRDCCCYLASQVNREASKTGTPELHQMRGAGTLEERARKVIIVSKGNAVEYEPGADGRQHIAWRDVLVSIKKNKGDEGDIKARAWGPKGIVWPGAKVPPWVDGEQRGFDAAAAF